MDVFNSVVDWFNSLLGLQYAGYGPVTAILFCLLTVIISAKILKFIFRPFVPLFQIDEELGEVNPVLAQQGIRQSQLMDQGDTQNVSDLREYSRDRARARDHDNRSGHSHLSSADDVSGLEFDGMDFEEALEEAWQNDQSAVLQEEITPMRPSRASAKHADIRSALSDLRPTAAAAPVTCVILPVICMTDFGHNSRTSGAAHRIAQRLGQGVFETLSRIPNLAVEQVVNGTLPASLSPIFVVEGSVKLQDGGVHVAIAVQSSADGSDLLAHEMTCSLTDLHTFEREIALEIASAVIAHQQPASRSLMSRLTSSRGGRSGSTYPSGRRPSPEHHHKTDQPVR